MNMNYGANGKLATTAAAAGVALAAVALLGAPRQAGAAWVVFDAGNFAQNVKVVRESIKQVQQLEDQLEALERQIESLDVSELARTVGAMEQVTAQLDAMRGSFGDLPGDFPLDGTGVDEVSAGGLYDVDQPAQWRQRQRDLAVATTELQTTLVESSADTAERVQVLVAASGEAPGPLAAQQAANELKAVQIQQTSELLALEIAALRRELSNEAERSSRREAVGRRLGREIEAVKVPDREED